MPRYVDFTPGHHGPPSQHQHWHPPEEQPMSDRTHSPRDQAATTVIAAAVVAVAALPIIAVIAGLSWRLFTWIAGL